MLSVFVCEDDPHHLECISESIKEYIATEDWDMELFCATTTPYEVLYHLRDGDFDGLYFVDTHLNSNMDGLQLAKEIRQYNPRGFIVFVSADKDSIFLTFKNGLEPMEYILKTSDDMYERINDCIRTAYSRYEINGCSTKLKICQ